MQRVAGKRGVKLTGPVHELMLSKFAAPSSPPPPQGDVTGGLTEWGMFANDKASDCGPAAYGHNRMAKAGAVIAIITDTYILDTIYYPYGIAMGEPGPNPDQGVDPQTFLKWLFDQAYIEAYAFIDHTNQDVVHQAMLNYNGVMIASSLTDSAENEFNAHQPWTITDVEQPDPNDGHYITLVKYDSNGDTFVTWGALQQATVTWDQGAIDSAAVLITQEDAARNGVDINALKQAIVSWGGSSK